MSARSKSIQINRSTLRGTVQSNLAMQMKELSASSLLFDVKEVNGVNENSDRPKSPFFLLLDNTDKNEKNAIQTNRYYSSSACFYWR
jgi:hypothetical protein